MNGKLPHLVQVGLLVAGGIACLILGQVEAGLMLIGAGVGNASPQNLLPSRNGHGLPPFLQGNPPDRKEK